MASKNYFIQVNAKCLKCNETLQDTNCDYSELKQLKDDNHLQEKQTLFNVYQAQLFPKMMSLVDQNFNLVLYGLGSKKDLLDAFRTHLMKDKYHLVIQGFMDPTNYRTLFNSLKSALDIEDLENISILDQNLELDHHLYLIIHSLDTLYSSNKKIKSLIDTLLIKGDGKIHLIASVDQLNSGLIWTVRETGQLNLIWLNCPTFDSYALERSYAKKINSKSKAIHFRNQQLSMAAISNVYRNLTPNAQKIFILILQYYLTHQKQSSIKSRKSQAKRKAASINDDDDEDDEKKDTEKIDEESHSYSFVQLYHDCRDEFLVNSQSTLKTQLIEFIDHKLIKSVTHSDGKQYVQLLVPFSFIPSLLNELKNAERFCNQD